MDAEFAVYWDLLRFGADEGLRLTALRAFFFRETWPGVYRVGLRRW